MISFEELFRASKGQPVNYQGQTLCLVDLIPVSNGTQIKITFESSKSNWRQGIMIRMRGSSSLVINGQDCNPAILWQDTAPSEVICTIRTKKRNDLEVKNIWDTGDGTIQSWHNGAAMIVHTTTKGRRYLCNDGYPDDDFDDVIFRIEEVG